MNIFNETNELAEKISSLLNKEDIESELGTVLVYILEEADSHLMTYLEDQAETWQGKTIAGHSTSPTHNRALQMRRYRITSKPARWLENCRTGSLEKLILVLIIFIHCRKGSLEKFVLNDLLLNRQFPSIEGMNQSNK